MAAHLVIGFRDSNFLRGLDWLDRCVERITTSHKWHYL